MRSVHEMNLFLLLPMRKQRIHSTKNAMRSKIVWNSIAIQIACVFCVPNPILVSLYSVFFACDSKSKFEIVKSWNGIRVRCIIHLKLKNNMESILYYVWNRWGWPAWSDTCKDSIQYIVEQSKRTRIRLSLFRIDWGQCGLPFFPWIKNSHMMEYLKSRIHTFSTFFHLTKSHTCSLHSHMAFTAFTHTRQIIQWLYFTCLLCCIRHRSAEVDWMQLNCVGFSLLFFYLSFYHLNCL